MFVYLIGTEEGYYKIGRSKKPATRIYQVGGPFAMRLLWSVATDCDLWLEGYLHDCFFRSRKRGEWFRLTPADVALIKAIPEGCRVDEASLPLRLRRLRREYQNAMASRPAPPDQAARLRAAGLVPVQVWIDRKIHERLRREAWEAGVSLTELLTRYFLTGVSKGGQT